jgi:hypothetical protein
VGVILPGTYADLVEQNVIAGNANNGVFGIEVPTPFLPPTFEFESNGKKEKSIFFQLAGNRVSNNLFFHNGYGEGPFPAMKGDVTLASGANEAFLGEESRSKNNCVSGNFLPDSTFPKEIEATWGCRHDTTPNPGGGPPGPTFGLPEAYEYIIATPEVAAAHRKAVGQPAPPPQPTMPNPCRGVPRNPLCT